MLLEPKEQLEERLVRILALQGASSTAKLRVRLASEGKDYTRQAIYKELAKLQKNGVIYKLGKTYGLSLPWITQLRQLVEQMQTNYVEHFPFAQLFPQDKSKSSWVFPNLLLMDDFWNQLLISLFNHCQGKIMFEWIPHAWYRIFHLEKDL
ncbi:hypothetical protein OAO01_07950, partial [Oligoflexia bacterium]|nr:hypothetical protein [Oligoflexia bacterium]